jgi:adenylate kinase
LNIFVAGIHGVGKSYLAGRLPASLGLLHTSASKLIREECALPTWGQDKRVANIDDNQIALAAAVARHNAQGSRLLLDGHFVLLDQSSQYVRLAPEIFRSLNLNAVILVEAPIEVVARRVLDRDGVSRSPAFLDEFAACERAQACAICAELSLPLQILVSPSDEEFASAIHAVRTM